MACFVIDLKKKRTMKMCPASSIMAYFQSNCKYLLWNIIVFYLFFFCVFLGWGDLSRICNVLRLFFWAINFLIFQLQHHTIKAFLTCEVHSSNNLNRQKNLEEMQQMFSLSNLYKNVYKINFRCLFEQFHVAGMRQLSEHFLKAVIPYFLSDDIM